MTGWAVSRGQQSYLSMPFGDLPQALLSVAFEIRYTSFQKDLLKFGQ